MNARQVIVNCMKEAEDMEEQMVDKAKRFEAHLTKEDETHKLNGIQDGIQYDVQVVNQ